MGKLFPNAVMRTRALYRFDIVDSFLRSDSLKQACCRYAYGECSLEEMHYTEDREIVILTAKEEAVDLPNVTDGEFRRARWHLDFLFELLGVELAEARGHDTKFQAHMHHPVTLKVTGKIEFPNAHPFPTRLRALQKEAGSHPVKLTIPSPNIPHLTTYMHAPDPQLVERCVSRNDLLLVDTIAIYIKVVSVLYNAGYRILRLDDTPQGEFYSGEKRMLCQTQGVDVDATACSYAKMLNDVRAAASADTVFTMHVCHGNFRSTWFSNGDYGPVVEILFGGCSVGGFFLEYGNGRASSFKPLCFIKSQQVVLELVTSKSGKLEDRDVAIGHIKGAAQYVDIDQLCLGLQCGFASTEEGNVLTEEEQWKKLALTRSVVEEVWGNA